MANRFRFTGLEELRADLRKMPEALRDEASEIVLAHAQSAAKDIIDAYPERTGNLKRGVKVVPLSGSRFFAGAIVRNTAKHAFLFEHGSKARHTEIGANRGAMPAGNVFIPRMQHWRTAMYDALAALLERHGLRTRRTS
jgi:hypothetical protein